MSSKEIDRRDTYKKNKKSFDMLKKASGNKVKKLDFDPVALGIIKKKKTGGVAKKMNMGGVLKNRGGTFKGTY
jgi:hypothetical protein|tara:strand:+ start:946 stop:1164 length:219 start_codon:yes stop_codon:yes gene_type:complete